MKHIKYPHLVMRSFIARKCLRRIQFKYGVKIEVEELLPILREYKGRLPEIIMYRNVAQAVRFVIFQDGSALKVPDMYKTSTFEVIEPIGQEPDYWKML